MGEHRLTMPLTVALAGRHHRQARLQIGVSAMGRSDGYARDPTERRQAVIKAIQQVIASIEEQHREPDLWGRFHISRAIERLASGLPMDVKPSVINFAGPRAAFVAPRRRIPRTPSPYGSSPHASPVSGSRRSDRVAEPARAPNVRRLTGKGCPERNGATRKPPRHLSDLATCSGAARLSPNAPRSRWFSRKAEDWLFLRSPHQEKEGPPWTIDLKADFPRLRESCSASASAGSSTGLSSIKCSSGITW
jgi:hypothetical protein